MSESAKRGLEPREGVRGRDERRVDWRTKHVTPARQPIVHGYVTEQGKAVDRAIEVNVPSAARAFSVPVSRLGCEADVGVGPCRAGVPSRDGTAGLGRTVWSTTTQRKGRSVERPIECRGRLVWRTQQPWGRAVSVIAPGEPGGGAIARGDHVRMGVDARRARILRLSSV